jgi:hypothetical protein
MALGELQLKPSEFWELTGGELMAMIRGFIVRRDLRSADHRNLFTLFLNANRRKNSASKKPEDVWPLDIDHKEQLFESMDDRLKFYKNIGKNRKN